MNKAQQLIAVCEKKAMRNKTDLYAPAYEAGYEAGKAAESKDSNPFKETDPKSIHWDHGWHAGQDDK